MNQVTESADVLRTLGERLRAARLQRDDSMAVFAERLGVSERTLRAMERGEPTVQIGTWLEALWILDRLDELRPVLESRESLIERARSGPKPRRQRASRRPR
jgi:transcriptional regulator with XRE-family HTH domain